jgi:hypothetical protein
LDIFTRAFARSRTSRSEEYKRGVLHGLRMQVDGAEPVACPYNTGTAQADAYYAGREEARVLASWGVVAVQTPATYVEELTSASDVQPS